MFPGVCSQQNILRGCYLLSYYLLSRNTPVFTDAPASKINTGLWIRLVIMAIVIIGLLALLSVSTHGELEGSNQRFPYIPEVKKQ